MMVNLNTFSTESSVPKLSSNSFHPPSKIAAIAYSISRLIVRPNVGPKAYPEQEVEVLRPGERSFRNDDGRGSTMIADREVVPRRRERT
jgi:hypothetical protein